MSAPLFVVKGDATSEEVAALVAVLQAAGSTQSGPPPQEPSSEWSANHRKLRTSFLSGPDGWRSSSMPRS